MGVIASDNVTLVDMTDVSRCAPYYLAQSAQAQPPLKPNTNPPTGWSTTEPAYDASKVVYVCWLTEYSNGEFDYSDVSLMSSYTGANEAWNKADNAQTVANNANDKAVAFRGTCSTGATAQAKTATCTNFSLTQGATVTIYNTTAQTYSNNRITLNVNGTGDKEVHVNGAATSADNQLLWTAGSIITFTYNGTYWYVADEPGTLYATCTTAADYSVKSTSSLSTAVIRKGTRISILMSNANSANTPELNVASTGAKYIYAGGTTLSSNSLYNWQAGSSQSFTFDGGIWRMDDDTAKANAAAAARSATDYITNITSAGVFVHADGMVDPEDITSYDAYGVHIDQDVDIIRGGEVVATYGEDVTIGKEDYSRAVITPTAFSLINGDNNEAYIYFGDIRGSDGIAEITEMFAGGNSSYQLRASIHSISSIYFSIPTYRGEKDTVSHLPVTGNEIGDIWYVEADGKEYIWDGSEWIEYDQEDGHPYRRMLVPATDYSYSNANIVFSGTVDDDIIIEITYSTRDPIAYYTFGDRITNSQRGSYSFSSGHRNTASGSYSLASGLYVTASGYASCAEGNTATASGNTSHAEGAYTTASNNFTHAEGNSTTASGSCSHAEGWQTTASGNISHAEGVDTISSGYASHAEGHEAESSGYASHAEGHKTTASGSNAHAEGSYTTASGNFAHAEGNGTEASGNTSHAEGLHTTASSTTTHAEGSYTTASGNFAHAEGNETEASGNTSHAEGWQTTASGSTSHAQNVGTIAAGYAQTAIGKWNIADSSGAFGLIIGNGSDSGRSDGLRVSWTGDIDFNHDHTTLNIDFLGAINDLGWLKEVLAVYYKGSKSTVAQLPATGNTAGDCWWVDGTSHYYIWTGTSWEVRW